MSTQKDTDQNSEQYQKFKKAARELKTDDSEEHFDAVLKKVAKALPSKAEEPKNDKK